MGLRGFGKLVFGAAAIGVVATAWTGCTGSKATEMVPGVISQISAVRNLKAVRVEVVPQGSPSSCFTTTVDPSAPFFLALPRTLGVYPPSSGGDKTRTMIVTVSGFATDETVGDPSGDCGQPTVFPDGTYHKSVRVLRRAKVAYTPDKTLFLPMSLRFSCWDAAQCPDGKTCKGGACVDDTVDSAKLVEYRPDMVDGTGNTCFSTKTCFSDLVPAEPVQTGDPNACVYRYLGGKAPLSGLNVRVFYDNDGGESEVLDLDPDEGFFVPDASKPQQFQLAPGLCKMVKQDPTLKHKIIAVDVASACPSKTVLQPLCTDPGQLTGDGGVPLPDGGSTPDGICNVAQPLTPAPSALYVVMDQSASMSKFFGQSALNQVLGFSLADPVFATTSIGLKILPHDGLTCTTTPNAISQPDIPFALAATAQQQVATFLANHTALAVDSPMYVDAALQTNGAYAALRALRAGGKSFNRLAVMLILNRNVQGATPDCSAAHALPQDEALAAFTNDGIYTYVTVLDNPNGPPSTVIANDIASGGGTGSVYDATTNQQVAAQAFNTIVADLGSCLYEKPATIDTAATISYPTSPLSSQTVPFNAGCTATSNASGWNFDGARVRICGQACTSLRQFLEAAAGLAFQQHVPAPAIPVTATQPCK